MRMSGWQLGTLGLFAALLALTPTLARADFDIAVDIAKTSSKSIKMERTGVAKDFIQRAAIYLRYIPVKANRVYPAFINTHNYLSCPGKGDKKWPLENASRVDYDKASGIAIYAFFFTRPECDDPTFHMEAITTES